MDVRQHLSWFGLEDHVGADDVELALRVKGDALLSELATVPEPRKLKVQALVSEDLALEGIVGVGAGFTALLEPTIEREA